MENLTLLLKFIEDLIRWDGELVDHLKEELEAAKKSLRFFRNFLGFTAKRCNNLKNLIIHAESLVGNMSCLLYMCCINDRMNDLMVKEMKMLFSSELRKFSPDQLGVWEIVSQALKSSKYSAVVDQFDVGFLDSLRDTILQLPVTNKLSFMAANKDQILSLLEELQFLTICFAMFESSPQVYRDRFLSVKPGSPYNPMIGHKSNYLLKRISTAITDIGSAIYSLHKNEQNMQEAVQLKVAVSNLQEIIRITKEDARKAYDMYIPKKWQPGTRIRTKLHMIRSLRKILKMIETIPQTLHSHGLSGHLSEVLQDEILSLIEAFCKLTAKQRVEHEELQVQMVHLNDITNETENLISSILTLKVFGLGYKLSLLSLFEEIKTIKGMFQDLQNGSTSKNCRKTSAEGILKDEARKMREQRNNNAFKKSHVFSINVDMCRIEDQLRWLETNLDMISPQREEIKALRLTTGFLKVILSRKGIWHIENGELKVFLNRICSVFQSADQDIQRLWLDLNIQISAKKGWCLPMNTDNLVHSVLSRLQLLKPDILEVYTILSKYSRFITGMSYGAILEILNSSIENIEVLQKCNAEWVALLNNELEAVGKSLRFSRNFLSFTAKRSSKHWKLKDLIVHAELLSEKMSCILYLCPVNDEVNYGMVNKIKMHLSSEVQKFSPAQPYVREIYIKALTASKSGIGKFSVLDEFDMGFLDSLQGHVMELWNIDLSSVTSTRDQILSLLEELQLLIKFFCIG